jgi:hypothetical protein
MSLHTTLENLFLKIFRNTVLVLMTIAILAVPVLLLTAAYKFLHSPGTAPSTEQTLSKELDVEKLKQNLLKDANKNNAPQESPKPVAPQQNDALLYKDKALTIYKCGDDFKKATGAAVESSDSAQTDQQIEFIRSNLERLASLKFRGDAYVNGVTAFTCKVLKDSSIVDLKKQGKIGAVLIPTINTYTANWDEAVNKNAQYEATEIQKALIDKAEAVNYFYIACSLFLSFMVLALYLMLSRVENHIGGINQSFRDADISIKSTK